MTLAEKLSDLARNGSLRMDADLIEASRLAKDQQNEIERLRATALIADRLAPSIPITDVQRADRRTVDAALGRTD